MQCREITRAVQELDLGHAERLQLAALLERGDGLDAVRQRRRARLRRLGAFRLLRADRDEQRLAPRFVVAQELRRRSDRSALPRRKKGWMILTTRPKKTCSSARSTPKSSAFNISACHFPRQFARSSLLFGFIPPRLAAAVPRRPCPPPPRFAARRASPTQIPCERGDFMPRLDAAFYHASKPCTPRRRLASHASCDQRSAAVMRSRRPESAAR